MERPTVISGSALLPISLVIIIIGGVSWLTTIYEKSDQAFAATQSISEKQDVFQDRLSIKITEMLERLARIEQDITYLKEQSKKEHRK